MAAWRRSHVCRTGATATARLIIDAQDGPVVLVGTDQNVAALVYIAVFAPDKDESVDTL
jgi:hypothetical protein